MTEKSESFCSSTTTHYYPAAQQFPKTIYIFACVVSVIISVSSTLGNTVILFTLRKCQSIHPPSKALLCSFTVTGLLVGLVVLPLFIAYYLTIILEIPQYYCVMAITYGRISPFIGAVSLEIVATIAFDRYLAFRLRLRYREIVKLRRIIFVLVLEWIVAAVWTGSWYWNVHLNIISGAIGLLSFFLTTPICYLRIHCGLRRHVAQIHRRNSNELAVDFNVIQYKKTVNNMLWINGVFLVCYLPHMLSLFALLATGLGNSTRFALHFSTISIYFYSSLNPILYCWKIKELREKVIAHALLRALHEFVSPHSL